MGEIPSALQFDPDAGTTVFPPPGSGYGNWVGGKVSYDPARGQFTLFYRERRPLEHGRAASCGIAISDDGLEFHRVWTATKEEFAANSIEEGHCVRDGDEWLLYVSYEVSGTTAWRIDLMSAADPAGFEAQRRRTVLEPRDYGLAWIKDPFLMRMSDQWWLYAAVPARAGPEIVGDTINAAPMDATVLAVSEDGRYFPHIEYVFEAPGDDSWHGRRARINSVVPWGAGYVAFFDGGRTFYDNYEEKAGLATSPDGRVFTRLDTREPWLSSKHGIVRYVCAVPAGSDIYFYYEYTREDGSHELRVSKVSSVI